MLAGFQPGGGGPAAPAGGFETRAAAQTARRGQRPTAARPNMNLVPIDLTNQTVNVSIVGGAKGFIWVAPDTTNMVGVVQAISGTPGVGNNYEIAVYDEHLTKIGGSGLIACPAATGDNLIVSFPAGSQAPVVEGRPYLIVAGADNTSLNWRANTFYLMGDSSLLWRFTNGIIFNSGLPAQINPKNIDGAGAAAVTQSSGQVTVPMLLPLLEPVNVKKVASDITVQNATGVIGRDVTNNRLFAFNTGGSHLLVSTDLGVTTTDVGTWTGEQLKAVKVAGAFTVMGSQVSADNTGKLRIANRTGPFDPGSWTDITPAGGLEGYPLPWNLSVSDDGVILVGNYTAPNTNVRIRKSTNWGSTFTLVEDLGATRTANDGVTASGSKSYASKTLAVTNADIGALMAAATGIASGAKVASLAATTVHSGSLGISPGLPVATIDVASATGFEASGWMMALSDLGLQYVKYTGISVGTGSGGSDQFTGCTGGTGHLVVGNAVTQTVMTLAAIGDTSSLATTLSKAEHVHSVLRSTITPTKMYSNIGDSSPFAGWYVSTDTGSTWTRKAAFGTLRVTQLAELPDGKIVGGSDDFGTGGGNLFVYDPVADTLRPFSNMPSPWYGDVYALRYDSARDWIWYMCRGNGTNTSRRAGLFVSPDRGVTSYLVADLGVGINAALDVIPLGNYVFLGDGQRFPISSISFP